MVFDSTMDDSHAFNSRAKRSADEKKILYCEVCEVPCRSPLDLQDHFKGESHKKKERAMMYGGFKVEELERIIQKVKCLTDYVEEKEREPLVGLEYVVEYRCSRMANFDYNCELCASRSKLIPMIVHLNGLKHRKAYISKHFPFTAKNRDPKEDLFQFLRRMALEIERYRGVKMFRVEPLVKGDPGDSFPREFPESLKRKKRWDVEGSLSDGEPSRKRFSGLEERFEGGNMEGEYEKIDRIVRAKRVAEILQQVKPLNKAEARAMKRAKAMNKAAERMESRLENRMGDLTLPPRGLSEQRAKRVAEILQRVKPLNKDEAIAMQRAKALNKAAEVMKSSLEHRIKDDRPVPFRGHFDTEDSRICEEERRTFMERGGGGWDMRAPDQKDSQEEWKKFFLGGSGAEKFIWEDKLRKNEEPWKSENRNWAQPYNAQKKQSEEVQNRVEAEKRAEAEKRVEAAKRAQAERVAKAKSLADSLTRIKDGQKSHTAQTQQGQGTGRKDSTVVKVDEDKLARAKRVAESITQSKPTIPKSGMNFIGKLQSMQPNKPGRNATGTAPAVKPSIAEKRAHVNHTADAGRPLISQGTFVSDGNWNRDSQMTRSIAAGFEGSRRMPQDMQRGGMPLGKAFATAKQEPWNPPIHGRESNRGLQTDSLRMETMPWRHSETLSTPVAAASLPDDNVVDILETFLKQSLGQEEPNHFGGGGNWNSEPLMQNKPAQLVTASGTWNLVPMAQKQQIQQAVGQGNWNTDSMMQSEKSLRANFSIYDPPSSSFGSSSLNQLNLQTKSNTPSFLGAQANSDLRQFDSRGPGSFYSANRGFNSEFNQGSNVSYPSLRAGGPSYSSDKLGMDYKANSMLRSNPSGPSSNLMSDVNSNWQQQMASGPIRDLQDLGRKFTSIPANLSHGYLSGSASKFSRELQGNAERTPRSSLPGDLYRDGIRDLEPSRIMTPVRKVGQNRMAERDAFGLPSDVLNKVRGKDAFTSWAI